MAETTKAAALAAVEEREARAGALGYIVVEHQRNSDGVVFCRFVYAGTDPRDALLHEHEAKALRDHLAVSQIGSGLEYTVEPVGAPTPATEPATPEEPSVMGAGDGVSPLPALADLGPVLADIITQGSETAKSLGARLELSVVMEPNGAVDVGDVVRLPPATPEEGTEREEMPTPERLRAMADALAAGKHWLSSRIEIGAAWYSPVALLRLVADALDDGADPSASPSPVGERREKERRRTPWGTRLEAPVERARKGAFVIRNPTNDRRARPAEPQHGESR